MDGTTHMCKIYMGAPPALTRKLRKYWEKHQKQVVPQEPTDNSFKNAQTFREI
jgi:hypothetical protein